MRKQFNYDQIGYWSEVKLAIIREYAAAYSQILTAQPEIRRHVYIDAFAGAGKHLSRRTGEFVPGSPFNALLVKPPFREIHLIDLHGGKAEELRKLAVDRQDVHVHEGDANTVLLNDAFPRCRWEDFSRGLCLLDPYGLNVNWSVLETAGHMETIEIFYNFMIMDANMNVLWRNPQKVDANQAERLDVVWGDRSWRDAAYRKEPGLFGDIEEKAGNEEVAEAFRKRLREASGFAYVPEPMPMRNEQGAVVYYLFFASPNQTGAKIVEDVFDKYRSRGAR
ncbi:MAG: three-Cys-motif partner protein TcmP [Acidobacteria bacterium]|nr:three-Cys-motif partner protein TcmP [Acidobacteriota bacterium]